LKLRKHTSAWIGSMVDILRASIHFVERLYVLSCSNFNLLKGKEGNAIKREEGWKQQLSKFTIGLRRYVCMVLYGML